MIEKIKRLQADNHDLKSKLQATQQQLDSEKAKSAELLARNATL